MVNYTEKQPENKKRRGIMRKNMEVPKTMRPSVYIYMHNIYINLLVTSSTVLVHIRLVLLSTYPPLREIKNIPLYVLVLSPC